MFQEKNKETKNRKISKRFAWKNCYLKSGASILTLLFCVMPGCVSPEAIKADIQGIRNDMSQLKKVVEQKADNTVVAEQVNEINNKIEQTTQLAEELSVWRKNVQAETINYSGAGWVMASVSTVVLIFVGAGLLLIKAFVRRGSLLTMLTRAVKMAGEDSPNTIIAIKKQLKCSVKDGHFSEQDRKNLGNFARKKGTFAE